MAVAKAIDDIRAKQGVLVLDSPGCQRVACVYDMTAIDVCFEPVENGPDALEHPWSHVTDFAEKLSEEWCRGFASAGVPLAMQGGKVWDDQGFAVDTYGVDKC
ncbi:hypothetical protein IMZ48_20895 [Candidatus Bathyarchaeota archaeon]|nr:hypothetical protein [Candidatus Bathyarchaeota archaeon]